MTAKPTGNPPKLLSGGNPQIAKGYGEEPVRAWIDAAPDWKGALGARLDATITREVPGVVKAVKWNSPFYGMEKDLWFLCLHCYTKFLRVTFFHGNDLDPKPEKTSKYETIRYYDIPEGGLDEDRFADWVRQAATLPGEKM